MNVTILLILVVVPLAAAAKDSCRECHSVLEGKLQTPVPAFASDVHNHRGFSCADCHGGDPKADDPYESMNPAKGYLGKISRAAVPKLCARCHSDATLIHKFKPQQRVDQYAQYLTSVHGKRLAAGDTAVANCADCHGVHQIREVRDTLSPVHPLRLPETCAHCHSDVKHMAKYKLGTEQFAEYRTSVHWEALSKRGDLSAPSCASCHGNHGATPPQVSSVAAVCGTCHVLLENLYQDSPHKPVFAAMGEGGCAVCHGNHAVQRTSVEMLAGPSAVCAQCHEADSKGGVVAAEMANLIRKLGRTLDESEAALNRARQSGMEVSEALIRQIEARENLVKARVAVHAFQLAAVQKPVEEGMGIAAETRRAGEEALKERDRRRVGLGLSLITILVTMAGLWIAIRTIEGKQGAGP